MNICLFNNNFNFSFYVFMHMCCGVGVGGVFKCIFLQGTNDGVLYPFCAHISENVLAPALEKHFGLSELKLHWAFLRKFTMDGRIEFPVNLKFIPTLF